MITTSHKPQAKRITTNSCPSSVESTNLKKRITMGPGELTESTNLKKRITMGPGELTESLFFLFKKASSNKQRAHLLLLDNLYYKII